MKNYVISLATATERRQHIAEEFGKQGIIFEFFDAVTPNDVDELVNKFDINIQDANLTKGELACFFSHLCLWQKAIDDNLDYLVVFEDDVYLGKDAHLFLKNSDWIPSDCELIKIEHYLDKLILGKSISEIYGRHIKPLKEFNWGTAGYIIHKSMIDKLMNVITEQFKINAEPIDHIMFETAIFKYNLPIYQMTPALSTQSDRPQQSGKIKSTLEQERRSRMNNQSKPKPRLTLSQKINKRFERIAIKIARETVDFR